MPNHPTTKRIAERLSRLIIDDEVRTDSQQLPEPSAGNPGKTKEDQLAEIVALAHEEIGLIRGVLDLRFSGGHVTPEQIEELRRAHRRGLAVRRSCGDAALAAELGWLQGYGSFALMADLTELDRERFERELAFRVHEIECAIDVRRARLDTAH